MPNWNSRKLGSIEYDQADVLTFPKGLAGFEKETSFVPVQRQGYEPVVFLQSLSSPDLCFLTVPVDVVDKQYQLRIMNEDLQVISPSGEHAPPATEDLACLAIVCLPEQGEATANLLGPLVVNRKNRVAIQAIRDDSKYSATEKLTTAQESPC
jgi:flagellar assembly factor FliW